MWTHTLLMLYGHTLRLCYVDTHSSYIIWTHSLGNHMLNMFSAFTGFGTAGYRGGFQLGENDEGRRHDHQCCMTDV